MFPGNRHCDYHMKKEEREERKKEEVDIKKG